MKDAGHSSWRYSAGATRSAVGQVSEDDFEMFWGEEEDRNTHPCYSFRNVMDSYRGCLSYAVDDGSIGVSPVCESVSEHIPH